MNEQKRVDEIRFFFWSAASKGWIAIKKRRFERRFRNWRMDQFALPGSSRETGSFRFRFAKRKA